MVQRSAQAGDGTGRAAATCRGAICRRRRARRCCAVKAALKGCMGFFAQMERKKYKLHVRVMLSKYRGYAECPDCRGQRLRAEARAVRIEGKNICQVTAMTIAQAKEFFNDAQAYADAGGDCRADSGRGAAAADVSGCSGAGVPDAGPAGLHAFRRRGAAHPACDVAGLAAGGRVVCAR